MKISTLIVVAGLAGCGQSPRQQAEDVREEAVDVMEQARDVEQAVTPEEKLEEQVDVAKAREDLANELKELADTLQSYDAEDLPPAARENLVNLQQRYLDMARRLEAAGNDPAVIQEIHDAVQELDRDAETWNRDYGAGT